MTKDYTDNLNPLLLAVNSGSLPILKLLLEKGGSRFQGGTRTADAYGGCQIRKTGYGAIFINEGKRSGHN